MMKTIIQIYGKFTLNEIKRQFAYKGSFYLFIVCSMFASFINYFLWKAIYENSSSNVIGGLSENEMIVYVFISYITSSIIMIDVIKYITDDIQKGTIAMNLIKPINYRATLIAKAFGSFVYHFFVPCFFIAIGVEIYKVCYLNMPGISLLHIVLYLISLIFSFLIYVLFDYILGMVCFFTTYTFGLNIAKSAILAFVSGSLIPLSFFPKVLSSALKMLPFSSMVYDPVMIYIGKYTDQYILYIFAKQVIWIAILYYLGHLLWKIAMKRLVVLGG